MLRYFLPLLCILCTGVLNAQSVWHDVPANATPSAGERRIVPEKFRSVRLDLNALQPALASAPEAYTMAASTETLPIIDVPTPDGKTSRFQVVETPVMAPELQEKYPDIRCYTGQGIDDPGAKIKLDLTPWGFHAMVMSNKGSYFIDPMVHGNRDFYVVYFKKDYVPKQADAAWTCATATPDAAFELDTDHNHVTATTPDFQGDTKLRRYRLALACTGEYATYHGGTKPLVLAAMNTTMNRVNGVYETDLAITMRIVANNDLLIYLNAGTDPFTNNDGGTMLGQNQTTCTNVIGTPNFDIGHVFSTGGGGVAFLGIICSSTYKARGVTGLGAPIGDPFDIDYVAHEMGHQFGGPHTFNGNAGACGGNESPDDAVEPGSGSTIMAYAGICGTQNLQAHSDAYFSANSLINITSHAIYGSGNTCAEKITSNNHNPNVNAGSDYIIPKSTPFALTAVGTDIDGDTLNYTWEQMDAALTANPPAATSTAGPMFRSFSGTASPIRVFPRLQDIVNNVNPTWEELPSVARTMNFRIVLRDNDWLAGCTDEDDMVVTVSAASGPFIVTVPNTNIVWNVGTTQTVTWNVANTTAAPVSCANVRISLSTDGGFTYPIVLAASEPNDGSASITVPNNLSNTCRVKVEGLGNIFFDISNANFRIEEPVAPTFFLATSVSDITACAGINSSFDINLTTVLGFNTSATVNISGAPAGASVLVNPNPLVPAGTTAVNISNLTPAMAGVYTLSIQVVAGSIIRNGSVTLTVLPGAPGTASLTSPADGATGIAKNATLSWSSSFAATSLVEVATNPAFTAGSIVFSQTVSGTSASITGLTAPQVYYWRVRASNTCGDASVSAVYAFQVGNASCDNNFSSTDVPKAIDQATVNTASSTLNVASGGIIEDVNVNLVINHSYVGDLRASLVSPTNDTLALFDQPGVPASQFGCNGVNVDVIFDSEAADDPAVLDAQCSASLPAISGTFQSIDPLSALNGKSAQGNWKLLVTDTYPEDGGAIASWSLSFCFPAAVAPGSILVNNLLTVASAGNGIVSTALLQMATSGTTAQGQFILLSLPAHGTLALNGTNLGIGDSFTQADIDGGLVVYTNNGDGSTTDNFHFDALDANNNQWVHNSVFNINIQVNNLAANAAQTQEVLCFDGTTGQITVTATGLNGVYTYSLNGGASQNSNVFGGLSAGTYIVVVSGLSGFTASTNPVTISNTPQILVSTSANTDDVTVTASGGTGVLEYSLNGVDFQPDNTFLDVSNGVYTVTVRDENGCTATAEVIVAVNSLLVTSNIQSPVSCAGGNDGSITVNVGGGQSPFSYSLNGGTSQPDNVFTGLSAGTYTVIVTDDLGFSATSSAIVLTNPAAINATANAVLNVVTVTASGGTGALEYSLNSGTYQSSNVFSGLTNGIYTVNVKDANGCITTTTITVDVPNLVLTATSTAAINCFGGSDGAITANGSGGVPPYEYKLDNGTYQSGNSFTGLSAGGYLVWVRDAQGTEVSHALTINQPAQIILNIAVSGNDATATFSGGVAPYTLATDAPNIALQNLPNGTYSVIITDAQGCTAASSFSINVPPLAWSSVVSNATCAGQANGSITVTSTGGIAPYEFSLNGGAFQTDNTFSGLLAGNYAIITRDADGTQVSGNVTVSAPPVLNINASVSANQITANASGGTPQYQYSLDGGPLQASGNFSNLSPGTYTVVATDANGCTASVTNLLINTAVIEPSEAWGLTISPNPGSGLFQLTMQQAPAVLRAELFDASGRLLRSLDFASNGGTFSTSLDLRDMPNGTYILRLTDGQQWGGVRLSKVE